jgi:hypothetical protein
MAEFQWCLVDFESGLFYRRVVTSALFRATAQRAHDFVIGWMSHSIPPGLGKAPIPLPR